MKNKTLQELIEENPSRTFVLEQLGINYRDTLHKTLEQVCDENGLDLKGLQQKLKSLGQQVFSIDFNMVSVPFLIEYLKNTHHDYAKTKLPIVKKHIQHISHGHERYRNLDKAFRSFNVDLRKHIILEEEVIFPFIIDLHRLTENFELAEAQELLNKYSTEVLCDSHDNGGDDEMRELRLLTQNFSYREDDELDYKIALYELKSIQKDLKQHAGIEDNVLFKKAGELEKAVKAKIKAALRHN